jgi:hypothetical protein
MTWKKQVGLLAAHPLKTRRNGIAGADPPAGLP